MKSPAIDQYIEQAAPFAQPILRHLRELVHRACPEAEEKLKWGFPHFDYKGVYTSMAAFKEHCAFSFWKAKLMNDPYGLDPLLCRDGPLLPGVPLPAAGAGDTGGGLLHVVYEV